MDSDPDPTQRPIFIAPVEPEPEGAFTPPPGPDRPPASGPPSPSAGSRAAPRSRLRVLIAGVAVTGVVTTTGIGLYAAGAFDTA